MEKRTDNLISGSIFIGFSIFLGIVAGIEHHSILGGFIVGGFFLFCMGIIVAMGMAGE